MQLLRKKNVLLHYIDENKLNVDSMSTYIRRLKIYARLLNSRNGTSLNQLSDEFLVSKTSIVGDFEIIQEIANKANLSLIRDKKGTRIIGDEVNIRNAMSELTKEFINLEFDEEVLFQRDTRLDLSTYYRLENLFDIDDLEIIETIIQDAEIMMGYVINELSYVNLITHLLILMNRMKINDIHLKEDTQKLNLPKEYMEVAHFIANEIRNEFEVLIPEEEEKYIHQYLVCSGIQSHYTQLELEDYAIKMDSNIIMIVEYLTKFVSDSIQCDLDVDKELRVNLISHMIPLIQRLKYGRSIKNPLLNEIKTQYAAVYSIIRLALNVYDNKDFRYLSDDEIGFITIHFQAAIERIIQPKNIIIVCPEGVGFSRLIAHRLERYISSVNIVDIISLSQINDGILKEIDFIVSTIPIKNCQKPVVVVSSFISENDISRINGFIVENSKSNLSQEWRQLSSIVDENVVFPKVKCNDKIELLKYVCDNFEKLGYITESYFDSVVEREEIISTDLGNMVAIPHGNSNEIIHSRVAIITLENPIVWNIHKVSTVFLIAMNMKEPEKTKKVIKDLYNMIDAQGMIDKIASCNTKEEIISIIKTRK